MKNLKKLKHFLEIEVAYSKKGIFISPKKHMYLISLKKERKLGEPQEFLLNKITKLKVKRVLV